MNETVDIINLDNFIRSKFADEEKKIEEYTLRLENLKKLQADQFGLPSEKIQREIDILLKKIKDACGGYGSKNFYIFETSELIDEYKKLLEKPIKINFIGKREDSGKEKKEIVKKFLSIASKYADTKDFLKNVAKSPAPKVRVSCGNCGEKRNYEIVDNRTFICYECGFQQEHITNTSSFKDVSRVNISSKYTYERRIHFRDCINQYQGKQNSTVSEKVYKDLLEQIRIHDLTDGEENSPKDKKFARVTKDHILLFLKITGHTKHYEDANLIFHNITCKKLDDISHLEPKLMDDFDKLSTLYDKKYKQDKDKKISRKSFINTQYVLYQLLRRHKHPCKKEEFNILKTLDRKSWHDDVCKELFEELGWNHFPSF
jgi:hypothetical protein